jgi:hypothetical protein
MKEKELNQNNIRTFYVVKNPRDNTYLSVSGDWKNILLCLEFNSEEDAMKELAQLEDCFFIIEKVYNI